MPDASHSQDSAAGQEADLSSDPVFDRVVDGIDFPDAEAEHAATLRLRELDVPADSLGQLGHLAVWTASIQAICPPRDFSRARVVIFAGDHGIAHAGVSARPPADTAREAQLLLSGGGAVNVLADIAGATVRLADIAVDAETDPIICDYKIRRSSGSIDHEDALSLDESRRALRAGMALADAEIDAGADLLIPGNIGVGSSTVAASLVAVLTDAEPAKVIGRGSGIDDATWIVKCAAIRDARRRAWPERHQIAHLMAKGGSADIAAMTGFILQGGYRRTPVLLDGLVSVTAALLAQRACPRIVRWLRASHVSGEPAHALALERLGLKPILELDIGYGQATGALLALPILRGAVRLLAESKSRSELGWP